MVEATAERTGIVWGREVVEGTVHGRHSLMYKDRPQSVNQFLLEARRWPDREFLVQGQRRLTYSDHEEAVARVAARLAAYGISAGDRVLLLGFNSIEWYVSFWALHSLGAVAALGNPWWSDHEITALVEKIQPKLAITDVDIRAVSRVPMAEIRHLVDSGEPAELLLAEVDESDDSIIMFSSGTTGLPKAILVSQRSVIGNMHNLLAMTNRLPNELPEDFEPTTSMQSVPLFHLAGVQTSIATLLQGGKLVMLDGKFDPAEVLRLIEVEKVRSWGAIPTMVSRVLEHPDLKIRDVSTLASVPIGGSAVPGELRDRISAAFPAVKKRIGSLYGLTETGGLLAAASGREISGHPGRVGKPLAVVEVKIANPDETGEGEIMGRTPNAPEAVLGEGPLEDAEGWIASGDLGRIDEEGYLYVTGRAKEIIIRGGENIATANIENTLLRHPNVADAGVVALPDRDLGEKVGAVVVIRPEADAPDAKALAELCREYLARYEMPDTWWIRREALPMNAIGKMSKKELIAQWTNRGGESLFEA
ncbi:class I adenylate-forming enzyme family protein [Pseudarthrobacter sulfonivorans]|uniref:class I adenylate-forming enzyme family protein n=1 Tax=Pseudarthrobacter sulfonivorans TaxID=121292 RepID=UPI00277D259E|nr:class I adenylate-forming enzyme family protein [Pseudarthrobacter sulfonivorans]MDP9998439.1 long-chain acyl-CoA synthetase [Pseudarthrobacter sulfonivorans]